MGIRTVVSLLIAIVFAGTAVFLAKHWLERQVPEPEVIVQVERIPTTTVITAARNLFFGDRLIEAYVQETEWPADTVPSGTFTSLDELLRDERVVVRQISQNEPITINRLAGAGGRASLSSVVARGMRAVTIQVNDILGVAGFVLPGDRVDIMLTREPSESALVTDILLQNVKVLGIRPERECGCGQPAGRPRTDRGSDQPSGTETDPGGPSRDAKPGAAQRVGRGSRGAEINDGQRLVYQRD